MAEVTSIFIYPEKDAPGQQLGTSHVGTEGLDGDRRKKAAVHLVSVQDYVAEHPRANLVVSATPSQLEALVGRVVRAGGVVLHIDRVPSSCPGVYASVQTEGDVSVGDLVLVADRT